MTRAIVTGGLGFIGSHVVDLLISEGHDVQVVDNLASGQRKNANAKADYIFEDVMSVQAQFFQEADYVFHLAALPRIQPSFDDPMEHERANVLVTLDLLLKLKSSKKLKQLVISASSSAYGDPDQLPTTESAAIRPLSPYALQKYASESYGLILGERYGLRVMALRYFNVYGPRSFNIQNQQNAYSSVIGIFAEQYKRRVPLTVTGDGLQSRDFVHVKDVARANVMAAESDLTGRVYNVGAGSHISVLELAKSFNSSYEFIPARKGEAQITWADISKIKKELAWEPQIPLSTGIAELKAAAEKSPSLPVS